MSEELPREWMRGPQWTLLAARQEWEPIIRSAAAAWAELEAISVSAGLRRSALLCLTPEELVRATRDCGHNGLALTALAWDGASLRAALHPPGQAQRDWLDAWATCDDDRIGDLLGFPRCCREHFARTWARGLTDTVLSMTEVDGPPEANTLLRHLGVRLVPHLPCSAACEATVALGREMAELGRQAGLDVDALYRLLSLPVKYSALHGVAITETPHFRFMSGTDWTAEEALASHAETCVRPTCGPDHQVCGYPVEPPHHHDTVAPEPATWEDNGFSTREAMEAAHAVVLAVAGDAHAIRPRIADGKPSAIDLGCGDGSLLERFRAGRVGSWYGVESDPGRAARGRRRHPELQIFADTIQAAASYAWDELTDFGVAFFMPGRLLEMSAEDAAATRRLLRLPRRVVAYAYGDWLAEYGQIASLCGAAGLVVVGGVARDGASAQAAEVTVA